LDDSSSYPFILAKVKTELPCLDSKSASLSSVFIHEGRARRFFHNWCLNPFHVAHEISGPLGLYLLKSERINERNLSRSLSRVTGVRRLNIKNQSLLSKYHILPTHSVEEQHFLVLAHCKTLFQFQCIYQKALSL
jgi:hypothetical protein